MIPALAPSKFPLAMDLAICNRANPYPGLNIARIRSENDGRIAEQHVPRAMQYKPSLSAEKWKRTIASVKQDTLLT